jgi:uncharacterized protein (TIGR03435 family)
MLRRAWRLLAKPLHPRKTARKRIHQPRRSSLRSKEQLGLKLESSKGPGDVIVIDHIELPTPNEGGPRRARA